MCSSGSSAVKKKEQLTQIGMKQHGSTMKPIRQDDGKAAINSVCASCEILMTRFNTSSFMGFLMVFPLPSKTCLLAMPSDGIQTMRVVSELTGLSMWIKVLILLF